MAGARPELIFVKGPQNGQRAVLMTDSAVAGRQAGCDVLLAEQYVSRQHFKFENTSDGWTIENVSTNGTKINGKLYKSGKKLILDTGDVIAVGAVTEILYVASGDSPEEAVKKYRQLHPDQEADVPPPPAPSSEPKFNAPPPPPAAGKFNSPPPGKGKPAASQEDIAAPLPSEAEIKASKKRSKMRLYMIGGGIYALLLVGVVIWLNSSGGPGPARVSDKPEVLTKAAIMNIFTSPLLPARGPSIDGARIALSEATKYYGNTAKSENIYLCVFNYRLYQAFQPANQRGSWPTPKDEANFESKRQELVDKVYEKYEYGVMMENQRQYDTASKAFNDILLKYIPQGEHTSVSSDQQVAEILIKNIRDHANYATLMYGAEKRKKKGI